MFTICTRCIHHYCIYTHTELSFSLKYIQFWVANDGQTETKDADAPNNAGGKGGTELREEAAGQKEEEEHDPVGGEAGAWERGQRVLLQPQRLEEHGLTRHGKEQEY